LKNNGDKASTARTALLVNYY